MDIIEADKETYSKIVSNPFCKFETAEFADLNKSKVDEVKYFIFNNGKNRFALIGGIKNNILKFPFSASFSCFSEITKKNKIEYYTEAVKAIVNWAEENEISKIIFNTPPIFYNVEHISKMQNALLNTGFEQTEYNLNYEFYLKDFDENYLSKIQRNARKNYNTALRNNLIFEKTDDIETVYNVIKQNRVEKGYPLWMSLDNIIETSKIIPSDYFLVKVKNKVYLNDEIEIITPSEQFVTKIVEIVDEKGENLDLANTNADVYLRFEKSPTDYEVALARTVGVKEHVC